MKSAWCWFLVCLLFGDLKTQQNKPYFFNYTWLIWVTVNKTPQMRSLWNLNSASLSLVKVLLTLLKCSITTETFHVERCAAEPLDTPAAFTLSFLCSAQRPKPQGGAAVWGRQGGSHSDSPELFHFKSTHQNLLPGRGSSPGGGVEEEISTSGQSQLRVCTWQNGGPWMSPETRWSIFHLCGKHDRLPPDSSTGPFVTVAYERI